MKLSKVERALVNRLRMKARETASGTARGTMMIRVSDKKRGITVPIMVTGRDRDLLEKISHRNCITVSAILFP